MNDQDKRDRPQPPAKTGKAGGSEGILRIEHDRRRLVAVALASGFAAAAIWVGLIVALAHVGQASLPPDLAPDLEPLLARWNTPMPWWTALLVAPAALLATLRFLVGLYQLQDGDPAFVLSPRGMQFKPSVFGERVRVPWNAIRSVKARRFKNHRSIVLRIDDIERHVPRSGPLGSLRRLRDALSGGGAVRLRTPMSQVAWKELAEVLQRYLTRYGRPPQPGKGGDMKTGSVT